MIDDLDLTLEELLHRELPPSVAKQISISFNTPDNTFISSGIPLPAINVFLYDIRENQELRNNQWSIDRQINATASKKHSPVRIDCSYLITAWPGNVPQPQLDEHRLLGEVIKVLLRHPTIPAEVLHGQLKGQELPLRTTALRPGQMQSIAEFWQAIGGKPKAALNYTVTISVTADETVTTVPLVQNKQIQLDLIGGK
jgi:hypothetical protein